MADITELTAGIDAWSQTLELDRRQKLAGRELGRAITDGLRLHRRIRELADDRSGARAEFDVEAARSIEAVLSRWLDVAKRVAADVAKAEPAGGGPVDQAAALDRSILYVQHALSFSADSAAQQLDRIAREGFRRGVTTEDLRRELLQGRVGN